MTVGGNSHKPMHAHAHRGVKLPRTHGRTQTRVHTKPLLVHTHTQTHTHTHLDTETPHRTHTIQSHGVKKNEIEVIHGSN